MDTSAADTRGTSAGPARAEGDPLPSLTAADAAFVDALRSALATDPGAATRPGLLRQKLESALGPDEASRQRPLVHQVVAASEENLPGYLTRIMPLTAQSLRQLSGDLAAARGWNLATAQRVTQIWAHALGFSGVADDWPAAEPVAGAAASDRPPEAPAPVPVAGGTALPPAPAAGEAFPLDVVAANETGPAVGDGSPAVGASAPTPWPRPSRRLARRHSRTATGESALGVTRGYAGMSLWVYIPVVSIFVLLLVATFVVLHLLLGVLPILVVVYLMRRALKAGVLVATASGLEFTEYSALGNRPKPGGLLAASWGEVTAVDGTFAVVQMAGHRIELGPLGRQFARAVVEHAGRGA
ncbi:MAG TPA: hypothetical protein VHW64_19985 [Nocardioides sp.]|jgi:hypothetical protein|uniref:hypothetical protein n=1 Tax=Nocardioides sp. TaxID=35761 RepID=UPI002E370A8C|nr:hypothetical protein [Nocardioides sp.]HEX3932977.1 hypothetical protein [Nocardioides sp.]